MREWQSQSHVRWYCSIGYGVRMPGGRLLTPFGAYGQSQFDRRLRFGAQLGTPANSGNEPLRIELSVQRHMRPGNPDLPPVRHSGSRQPAPVETARDTTRSLFPPRPATLTLLSCYPPQYRG